jgi:hypothetical protein
MNPVVIAYRRLVKVKITKTVPRTLAVTHLGVGNQQGSLLQRLGAVNQFFKEPDVSKLTDNLETNSTPEIFG